MTGIPKTLFKRIRPWIWGGVYMGLFFWLVVAGGVTSSLITDVLLDQLLPVFLIGCLLMVFWSALPRWRRLENDEHILWTANLPARIGSFVGAVFSPLLVVPGLAAAATWYRGQDYPHLAGLALLVIMTGQVIWRGLREFFDTAASVKVSAAGLQLSGRKLSWSEIQAIESGFSRLEGGSVVVLADERINLTPDRDGPTGRGLVGAVQRFSPGTVIREPAFQSQFGGAPA